MGSPPSNSTGMNLAPYHEAWGFPLDQSTFDSWITCPCGWTTH